MEPISRSTYGDFHGDRKAMSTSSIPKCSIRSEKNGP